MTVSIKAREDPDNVAHSGRAVAFLVMPGKGQQIADNTGNALAFLNNTLREFLETGFGYPVVDQLGIIDYSGQGLLTSCATPLAKVPIDSSLFC
jgi:hypothetical protein